MHKDYYKILGITEFDSAENIKNAYRKLARKYHPDIAGDNLESLSRFKEINEAYQILSNKLKKEEYDRARNFYNYAKGNSTKSKNENIPPKTNSNEKKFEPKFNFNWDDIFTNGLKKNKNTKRANQAPLNGEDVYTDIDISVFEALSGCVKTINMLQTQVCPKCNGHKFINGMTCQECNGKGMKNNYKKFTVKIPAEIKDKSKIRLANEGGVGKNGGKNGDLYITIHVLESKVYKTEGLDVLKTIPITPYEAVLGATISVSTIKGNVNFKIQPNTQNGQKIRLSKCGLVQNEKIGDMIVTVEIRIPSNLTKEEIDLYKKLEEISAGNIRDSVYDR